MAFFPLFIAKLCIGAQPKKCQLEIPELFQIPKLGCALLSFPWMYVLAFKKHVDMVAMSNIRNFYNIGILEWIGF